MTDRGFIIHPDGLIDEVDGEGNTTTSAAPGIYQELADAGYPLFVDPAADPPTDMFDVSVDADGQVTAYTADGAGTPAHPMGPATPKLALWLGLTKES